MNLYKISKDYQDAFLAMADMDELDEEIINDTLSGIETEFNDKAIAVSGFFQNIEADIKAMKDAEKRIAARRKSKEKLVARMKDYLRENMEQCGIQKIECPEFRITLRKAMDVVTIDEIDDLPEDYVKTKIEKSADKTKLKADLKEGKSIPGAHLSKGKRSLLIK
ncbi:siphovirus Gp157 family protein [Aliikangiella coralliicola]|uniref:Siphovirus Gp157 family protein n=1 Tax=Aliikangiella coralliicola TaxID=2592383 RepID=A0A545U030_9GAMM|nr:siphovirus Gp157 family protein [Aliikangiella coralliicola]TQV82822.1 siphovirus Gp157 family protein [Aliikangiella coralliicola]